MSKTSTFPEIDWRRSTLTAAIFLLWLLWVTQSVAALQHWMMGRADVQAYWFAGKHLREGTPLYFSVQQSPSGLPFLYPPALAVLFAILTSMTPVFGMAMWAAIHVLLLYALTRLIAPRLETAKFTPLSAQLMVLLFLSGPLAADIEEGQVNLLVTWLLGFGLLRLLDGRDRSAGALLACAVHVKVLPVVVLVALVLGKKYRAAKSMLITGLLLVLLPALAAAPALGLAALPYAIEQHWLWFADRLAPVLSSGELAGSPPIATPSMNFEAVLSRWFTDLGEAPARLFVMPQWVVATLHYLATAILVGVALFGAWRDRARASRLPVWGLLLFVAIQLSNVLCWPHHLMSLLLVVVFGLLALDGEKRRYLKLSALPFIGLFSLPTLIAVVGSLFGATRPVEFYRSLLQWGVPMLASVAIWVAAAWLLLQERQAPGVAQV